MAAFTLQLPSSSNIFGLPSTAASPSLSQYTFAPYSGGTDLTPTFSAVKEGEGGGTTTTDATGNVVTLPNFVVNEPKLTGGELGNIFNPNPIIGADSTVGRGVVDELSGATPGISSGSGMGSVGVGPTSTVKVGDTTQTVSFDELVRRELDKEIAAMEKEGVFTSDPQYGTRLQVAAERGMDIYNAAAGPARNLDLEAAANNAAQSGPGRGGPPIILPIAGLDPTTAALLTAAGLIFSGGKIARLNTGDIPGSVAGAVQGIGQTGQNAIDVATGKTTLGEIWNPGSTGAPSGTTPTGSTGTATGSGSSVGTGEEASSTGVGITPIFGGGLSGGGGAGAAAAGGTMGAGQTTTGGAAVITPGALGGTSSASVSSPASLSAAQAAQQQSMAGAVAAAGARQKAIDEESSGITEDPSGAAGYNTSTNTGSTTSTNEIDTCPSPDTPILLANGLEVRAGDLKVGDKVRTSHEKTGTWGNYPVSRVQIVRSPRLCLILDQGRFICSPSHKFSTGSDWKEARDFRAGDTLQQRTILASVNLEDGDVVSITVDDAHTYVSQGLLSHNKTPLVVTPPTSTPRNDVTTNRETVIPSGSLSQSGTASNTSVSTSGGDDTSNEAQTTINTNVPTSTSTSPTAATPIVINAPTTGYTLPSTGTPAQRNLYTEAGTTLASLASPMRQFQIGVDAQGKPIYGTVPAGEGGQPLSLSQAIAQGYGGLSQGMTGQDISNLLQSIRAQTGTMVQPGQAGGYQSALTQAANEQTAAANTALRTGNISDAEALFARAKSLREQANPQLYGDTGTLGQFATSAQNQVARDIAALRQAEAGQLTAEEARNAQQAAREAYAARGQAFSQGAAAQEVLNRQAAVQQRQQLARQNLAQSMGQLGQGIGYQTANIFDPMAATLGAQYGMQSQNVGMNQALYNQAMGLTSGAGGYGFAQQMINPFSGYAQDVYSMNVNALNDAMNAQANRQAALEAAKMGQTGEYAKALGTLITTGGLDRIQSGLSSGIQGVINLLGGKWPGSSTMITPTVSSPGS